MGHVSTLRIIVIVIIIIIIIIIITIMLTLPIKLSTGVIYILGAPVSRCRDGRQSQ
jgi:hypothetical protein